MKRLLALPIALAFAAISASASAQSSRKSTYDDLLKPYIAKTDPSIPVAPPRPAEPVQQAQQPQSSIASANWQHTRWHMTTQEVQAVSPNIVPTTSEERIGQSNPHLGEALLKSGYHAEELQYIAYYVFHANRLVAVTLRSTNPQRQGPTANLRLEKIYGPPIEDKSRRMSGGAMWCLITDRKWRSERDGNVIRLNGMTCNEGSRDFFSIRYEPILSRGQTGL